MRKFIKNYLNQLGMSMLEVLLAGAMAAGLGLVIAKLGQQSQTVNRTAETNIEMLSITQDISYILSDKDSCVATTQGNIGANLNSIKRVISGTPKKVYETNQLFSNKTIKLTGITTEKTGTDIVNLVVKFERQRSDNKNVYGGKNIQKKFPLKAVLSPDGNSILSCFSDIENMVEEAVKAACEGNAASYDPITKTCIHNVELTTCAAGEVPREIKVDGGKIATVCVSVLPADKTCGAGEYVSKIKKDGSITCSLIQSKNGASCGIGQYSIGLSGGNIECRNIPKCSTRSILSSRPTTGELYCQDLLCNTANQYFAGFDQDTGNAICKIFPDKSCGAGQYIKEVKANGVISCAEVPNHLSLPVSNYSFVDGFNATTKQWSRKSMADTCTQFAGFTWNGSKCVPPTSSGDDYQAICNKMEGYKWNGSTCVEKKCGETGVKCNVHCGFIARGATACTNASPGWPEKSWGKVNWETCQARCEFWMNKNNKGSGCWIVASNNYCYCRSGNLVYASNESFNSSDAGTCQLMKSVE